MKTPVDEKNLRIMPTSIGDVLLVGEKIERRHAFEGLQGLFHECKSNVERMVERISDSSYQQLQHFISDSEWDAKAVMKDVAETAVSATFILPKSKRKWTKPIFPNFTNKEAS